jgi:hypothetical protein
MIVNNELERMCKEAVVARNLPGGNNNQRKMGTNVNVRPFSH